MSGQGLVAEFAGVGDVSRSSHVARAQLPGLVGDAGVLGGRRILGGVKRVRPQEKTPARLAGFGRGWEFFVSSKGSGRDMRVEGPRCRHDDTKVPRLHQGEEAHGPLDRVGVG